MNVYVREAIKWAHWKVFFVQRRRRWNRSIYKFSSSSFIMNEKFQNLLRVDAAVSRGCYEISKSNLSFKSKYVHIKFVDNYFSHIHGKTLNYIHFAFKQFIPFCIFPHRRLQNKQSIYVRRMAIKLFNYSAYFIQLMSLLLPLLWPIFSRLFCIDMHFCLHQKIYSHSQFCPQLFICSPNERCHFQSLVVRDSNIFMYLLVTRFASVVHIWTSIFCNVLYLRLMIGFTIRADEWEWMNNVEKTENNTKKEWTHG